MLTSIPDTDEAGASGTHYKGGEDFARQGESRNPCHTQTYRPDQQERYQLKSNCSSLFHWWDIHWKYADALSFSNSRFVWVL